MEDIVGYLLKRIETNEKEFSKKEVKLIKENVVLVRKICLILTHDYVFIFKKLRE